MRGLFVRKSTVKPDFAGRKNRAYRLSVPICSVLLKMSDIIAYGNIFLCLVLWHYDFNRRDYGNSLGQFTRNYTQTTKRGLLTTNKG